MASIWSKTKLRRAESEEGFGGGSEEEEEEEEEGGTWEVEKDFRSERRKGGSGLRDERESLLRRRRENGVCAIGETERGLGFELKCLNPAWRRETGSEK